MKVDATFNDATGVVGHDFNHLFFFFVHLVHIIFETPKVDNDVVSNVDIQNPTEAPKFAPIGLETPMSSGNNKDLSLGHEIEKSSDASLGLGTPKIMGGIFFFLMVTKSGGRVVTIFLFLMVEKLL